MGETGGGPVAGRRSRAGRAVPAGGSDALPGHRDPADRRDRRRRAADGPGGIVSIPVPLLDDRTFADLVAAALERIRQSDPEWTDLTVHDPGVVLVEAFAHLTDMLMYRLNRLPERLYAVYLNLLGTGLRPPSAATTTVRFTRTTPDGPAV